MFGIFVRASAFAFVLGVSSWVEISAYRRVGHFFPPSGVSRYYKIIFTSYFGPLFFSQFSQTLTHHLLPLPGHQGRRLVAALRWRRLRPRPSRRRLGRRPTMCTWRPWCRRPCWCWKKSCSKWQLSRKKGIILISQLFYVELICYDLFNGEPIANASPRIMKGHVYFSIRDCKALRRDWSAIGSRLRQTLVVKNRLCKRRNIFLFNGMIIMLHVSLILYFGSA